MQHAAPVPAIDGRRPRVLIAPDKFKGTFSATEVAVLLGEGFAAAGWAAEAIPVADGGEGTADVLLGVRGGERIVVPAVDALGRPVEASYARLADGTTAVLDMAAASGLWRLAPGELDPIRATTAGTGMLVRHAVDAGATRIIVAAGGSATVDGGRGAVEAIGPLPDGVRIVVACDVRTRWEDAAAVFGPQKGAGCDRDAGVPCVAVVGQDALSAGGREALGLAAVIEAGTAQALRSVARRVPVPERS